MGKIASPFRKKWSDFFTPAILKRPQNYEFANFALITSYGFYAKIFLFYLSASDLIKKITMVKDS